MRAHARTELAWQAYRRALEAARRDATAARWRRLLAAARNLREALDDPTRARSRARAATESGAEVLPFPSAASLRWPELAWELRRAHRLVAWSHRLVAESRAQLASLADCVAERATPARSLR